MLPPTHFFLGLLTAPRYIKHMTTPEQALLSLMIGKYEEIHAIESRFHIFGHEGDYRPRIDYYHDAVRALGHDIDDGLSKDSRLSVERIAYDIEMLRIISTRPLNAGRGEQHFSTSDALSADGLEERALRPDRKTKQTLGQLYKDYTVYFTALLAEKAENNVQARSEEADILIEDCHIMEDLLTQLASGEMDVAAVVKAAGRMEHEGLRRKILALLNQGAPERAELDSAAASVKDARTQVQQEAQALDKEGMRVAGSKLAVYEGAKDVVKQLAANGLNIAGRFTERAVQQAQGRGERGR